MTLVNALHLLVIAVWLVAIPLVVWIWCGLRRNAAMLKQIEALLEEKR